MWADADQAEAHWTDAATLDPDVLAALLGAAQDLCEAYAPAVDPDPIPDRYTLAVVLQARELWAASKRDGDVIGLGDGYALRSRPLTGAVKSLLRPSSGIPALG